MSLTPRPARPVPTCWIDTGNGQMMTPAGTRSAIPTSVSLPQALDTAISQGAGRIMLTGKIPHPQWALSRCPGWSLHSCQMSHPWWALYSHTTTGKRLWLRHISEWGQAWQHLPQSEAITAYSQLEQLIHSLDRRYEPGSSRQTRAPLMLSPEATGLNLLALLHPAHVPSQPLPTETIELIRAHLPPSRNDYLISSERPTGIYQPVAVTGQIIEQLHGIELILPEALECAELGIGPATYLTSAQARAFFDQHPYHPARYRVSFTVPRPWTTAGLLPYRDRTSWYWPNEPGFTAQTWVGQAELRLAARHGWLKEIIEAFTFTHQIRSAHKTGQPTRPRPLDTWARSLRHLWQQSALQEHPEALQDAISQILTATIGALATPVEHTIISSEPTGVRCRALGPGLYATQQTVAERPTQMRHPEYTAQIRSGVAARLLDGPGGTGDRIGILHLPGRYWGTRRHLTLTETLPPWASATQHPGRWHIVSWNTRQ